MTTKIVVMTDVHGNLPALQAALAQIRGEGYDALYHTGDVVSIGPQSAECLEALLAMPNAHFVMGNHDAYLAHGLPQPQPVWMSDGEVRHHRWLAERVPDNLCAVVGSWPWRIEAEFDGVRTAFVHYGLTRTGRDFLPIIAEPAIHDLDEMFDQHHAKLVFYGHHHPFSDREGRSRYINPGSLGCSHEAMARYAVVTFAGANAPGEPFTVTHRAVPYDDRALFAELERRQVPERELFYRIFYGGRYP